ncbi:MAG: VOC family protein [Alphaproteobacteria bacterium]|nr:VOC family protein [Alphaproteobacteria bacterium]MBV9903897.1 VOC family protein [Alphaproteobacteria bacterium]
MLGYVTIGTNDFEKGKAFYEKALASMGVRKTFASDRMQGYGVKGSPGSLVVCKPYDEHKASAGNGTMVALTAPSRAVVDSVHKDALAAGGADEGAPGIRTGTFYGAYFRDPDGNKICVFTMGQ